MTHADFCKNNHLITTGNCHLKTNCSECISIWNNAVKATRDHIRLEITKLKKEFVCCDPGVKRKIQYNDVISEVLMTIMDE